MITLQNDHLQAQISPLGAELKSLIHLPESRQYLYPGDTPYWNRSAPVLFPIVGRLKNNRYRFGDNTYQLSQHGFARDQVFTCTHQTAQHAIFELNETAETLLVYPFRFRLEIIYELQEAELSITYQVSNPASEDLWFSIGAHPGFRVPFDTTENLSDYVLDFGQPIYTNRMLVNPASGNIDVKRIHFFCESGVLPLTEELFAADALVFDNFPVSEVLLRQKSARNGLRFTFENFPYFAIWSKPGAPFVCLEPWYGLADSELSKGRFTEKEGIIRLAGNQQFNCTHRIGIIS